MPSEPPAILQVFNRYLERGGEEAGVGLFAKILGSRCRFDECIFDSAEWKGSAAPPQWKQLLWMFHNPRSARRLREKQKQTRAQAWLVHNIFPVGSPAVYDEALRQDIPIVQFVHNFRPFSITGYLSYAEAMRPRQWPRAYLRQITSGDWQKSRLKTFVLGCVLFSMHVRNQFRAVKAWAAVSDFMRARFIEAGLPEERVFRLYPPCIPANADANFPEEHYYLFMGRLIEEKGIKVAVESWNILRSRLGAGAPRLVVTGGGPLQEWLQDAAAANPLVEYRGFVPEAEKHLLLSRCRAVIQPSIWAEPLSIVIYDAFDYGKPVLAAAAGGMPEMVGDSNGLIHQRGDAAHLAGHVEKLEKLGPIARRDMGRSGRKWLLANTNVDSWTAQLFDIVRYAAQSGQHNI
jgi:glycosyltransferase involved in cell wall biosynthesis